MKRKLLLSFLLVAFLSACGTAASAPPASTLIPISTATALPPATMTTLPSTATMEPAASPVEFVWSITGEPNRFNTPTGLAIDAEGNLYVVDGGNDRIQVFDPDGKFINMWGTSGSGPGEFNFRRGD